MNIFRIVIYRWSKTNTFEYTHPTATQEEFRSLIKTLIEKFAVECFEHKKNQHCFYVSKGKILEYIIDENKLDEYNYERLEFDGTYSGMFNDVRSEENIRDVFSDFSQELIDNMVKKFNEFRVIEIEKEKQKFNKT